MRKSITVFTMSALLFIGHTGFTQAGTQPDFTTLASTMKVMKQDLKGIAAVVDDPTQNAKSIELATEFVAATQASKKFLPKAVTDLPGSEQAAKKKRYEDQIDSTSSLGQQLVEALKSNNNTLANDLLGKLSDAKTQGHDEFKP